MPIDATAVGPISHGVPSRPHGPRRLTTKTSVAPFVSPATMFEASDS